MQVIAITGTNGKTSFCHFLAEALTALGEKAAVFGTLGNGIYGQHEKCELTTPDPFKLQALLAKMRAEAVKYVIMEMSSHGIVQGRGNAIDVDIAVYTNLSRDHLDYHGDMLAYGNAKRKLFQKDNLKHIVINIDDDFGQQLLEEFHPSMNSYAYSAEGRLCEFSMVPTIRAHHTHANMQGITASLHTPWGDGVLHIGLIGRFNLSNILAVCTVLGIYDFSTNDILRVLAKIKSIKGRTQLLGGGNKPHVVIDFAHTPDALKSILTTLKDYAKGDIWCVFGCGGNRDQGKRALMGQIAETYADNVIVTDDNPRKEDRAAIVLDILQGMSNPKHAVVEHNRRRAIAHAINCAKMGDIVLVAGKGHENYQLYGDEKIPFSDEVAVQLLLSERD